MTLEVKRQQQETAQALVYRFTKRIKQSGILRRARAVQFHARPKSRQAQKRKALRREELKKKYERLKKLGEVE